MIDAIKQNRHWLFIGLLTQAVTVNAATLEEVVVTAQKHEQSVNDVGITMNAFTGDALKDMGVVSSEDVALLTPGLTVNETAATGVPLYTIRGVGFQDYSTAASSTVGLYFDEVAMPYAVMSRGTVFDLERVEVLKGPQGDLYGRNTTAGQINYISKKPTEESSAGFTAGYGSYQTFDFEGYVNGSISENVNGRVAVRTVQSSKGWQKSLTRDDELGEKDTTGIRGLFDFKLGDNANLLLNLHYVNDESDNKANTVYDGRKLNNPDVGEFNNPYAGLLTYLQSGQTPPWYSTGDNRKADWTNSYTDPNGQVHNLRPRRDNQLKGVSAKLEWEINDLTLTSITAYDKFERVEANDWDGMAINDSSNINTTDLDAFSQELRLSGQTDTVTWIAGLYYSEDEMDELYNYFMPDSVFGNGSLEFGAMPFALAPILQLHTSYEQETDSKAIFGHVEWQFTEKARATVGLRYTEEERTWAGCTFDAGDGSLAGFLNTLFGANVQPGGCGTIDDDPDSPGYIFGVIGTPNANDAFHVYEETIDTDKWMGKLGLDYALNDDVLLYATYSSGFKSGGFNGANSNTTLQLNAYKEEELDSIELGFKSTMADGAMQFNGAIFHYDYKNKQEQDRAVTFVGNISGLTNVPESTIKGAEIDLKWAATDQLMINFGVAYLETEIDKWAATSNDSAWPTVVTFDASGLELAQAPEWSVNLTAEYEWMLSNGLTMRLAGDANYKDETTGGSQPSDATESYTVGNLRLSLGSEDDKWRTMLWARNVTDEYYFPAAYTGGNGPFVRSVGMPRTVGVSLSYNF